MTTVENGSNGRMVMRLMIASTILVFATGLSSTAYAQEQGQGAMASMQGAEMSANQHHFGSSIEGSWIFNINAPGQPTFHSLISFTAGGVVITSASLPGPAVSPFYGSWREAGRNRFHAAFYAFLPDAAGVGVALSKVSLTLKLTSRDALIGTAAGASCDLQGENCIQDVEFQFIGKRILPK